MTKLSRIVGVSSLFASCATPGVPESADPATRARAHINELTSGEVPGIQYRVLAPGEVVFASAAGVRDTDAGQAMEDATLQMAYSTTKIVTAVAVMQLVEHGRLAIDDPLSKYFPDHPYGDAITIRQLLAHTSGVPNPLPLDWFAADGEPLDRDEKLRRALAENPRLRKAPGEDYHYSNLSYWLLEKAIERASGEDYAAYVKDHVFGPLAVAPDAARFTIDGEGDLAVGHSRRFSPVTLFLRIMTPGAYWSEPRGSWSRSARVSPHGRAYGGLFATAAALGSVLQDLLKEDSVLLSAASKAAMFQRQHTNDGKVLDHALGWVVGEVAGERYFGKQGGGLGFHGNVRIYPGRRLATVLLANRTELSAGPIDARSDALDRIFLR